MGSASSGSWSPRWPCSSPSPLRGSPPTTLSGATSRRASSRRAPRATSSAPTSSGATSSRGCSTARAWRSSSASARCCSPLSSADSWGCWPGTILMRIADVQLSFPFIFLALTINAIVGLGLRNIIISLSAAGWVVYARVVRGEVLSVKQRDYVQAAAALGMTRTRMLFGHVLPNVAPSIIVVASLQFSQFIVAEAAISFLGFGVQPPTPAWGSMLSESRDYLYVAWWLAAFPGAALALTALGINLVGDWLRDVLDPKLRV